MKNQYRKIVTAVCLTVTLALIGAFSVLRADVGSCNGANITVPFTDVSGNTFFCQIAEAYFTGLTNGTTPTTYSPGNAVTRDQMAAFITRTLDQSLKRGSRRAALGQWWTQKTFDPNALTTVGSSPLGVQSDGEFLWVANGSSGTVTRVRASDGKAIETWTGMSGASALVVANGRIYVVTDTSPGKLYAINPDQAPGPAAFITDLGNGPRNIAFDGVRLVTADSSGGFSVYNTASGNKLIHTSGFFIPHGALFDGSGYWITDRGDGNLKKVLLNGTISQIVDVGSDPRQPVFDGANIWVPNGAEGTITIVRASTGAVLTTLTGNGMTYCMTAAFDGERVLITDYFGNKVTLWQATDFKPLGFLTTGASTFPYGACSDGINFFVTLLNSDKLARF